MPKFVMLDTASGGKVWVNPDTVATLEQGSAGVGCVVRFITSAQVVITNDKPSSVAKWLEAE